MSKLAQITIGGKLYMEVDADPSVGLAAPIGTLAVYSSGSVGSLFLKTGSANTAWSPVVSGTVDLTPYFKKDGSVAMTGAINPSAADTLSIGSNSTPFNAIYSNQLILRQGGTSYGFLDISVGIVRMALATNSDFKFIFGGTGALDMSTGRIKNLSDPTSAQDAATKAYVDAVALGLSPKKAVRVASTVSIVIASALINGSVMDGVTLATGDRVLLKDQSTPAENGIYVVVLSGPASRATDMDAVTPIDEFNGAWVPVQVGSANLGKIYVQYGTVATVGVSAVNFQFYNPLAALVGGDMITNSGSTFSVDLATAAGLESTAPGLVSGQLQVKLNGATLDRSASGMKVADGGISDLQINAAAAIAFTKMLGLTASRLPVLDASGKIIASSVTAVEAGYLSGVTSAIQTQLNGKWIDGASFGALKTASAESFFGTSAGNFDVSFYRSSVKVMAFEEIIGNGVVAIYAKDFSFKNSNPNINAVSGLNFNITNSLYMSSGALITLNSTGAGVEVDAYTGDIALKSATLNKILYVAGSSKFAETSSIQNLSPANVATSQNVQYAVGFYARMVKLKMFFKSAEGAACAWEKMVHVDQSGVLVLVQDSFTSSNALGNAVVCNVTVATSTINIDFTGLGSLTTKNIRIVIEDSQAL